MDAQKLNEVAIVLELLKTSVDEIKIDVREIKDGQLREYDRHMIRSDGRVERLEKIVYGACALLATETIGGLIAVGTWLIQKTK